MVGCSSGTGGFMMSLVEDCRDFVRIWNEKLDLRGGGSPEAARALAGHAAGCDACGGLNRIFLDLESTPASWSVIPAPSESMMDRWRAAAIASRTSPSPPRFDRMGSVKFAAKWGLVASVAASALIRGQALLTRLSPDERAPVIQARTVAASPRLEEAFAEAGTMTLELAREVSGPAARIGSEALSRRGNRPLPASDLTPFDEDEPSTDPAPNPRPPTVAPSPETAGIESISGSARYAFRFLIGSTPDDSLKSKTVGDF